MPLATETEISEFLDTRPGWEKDDSAITRTYEFANFNESMGFVTRVAIAAEKANHHPDIDIRWNKVTLTLSTHDEGGLTEKDFDLAGKADGFAG
jgi:4a-hydroxytetrahydrobiopterin dehydratase